MSFLTNLMNTFIPKNKVTAEQVIYNSSKNKIRSLEVEMLYNDVRYEFSYKMKHGMLHRTNILEIRHYLEKNVMEYNHKTFKNDAHAIYTMLMAKDIKVYHLKHVAALISEEGGHLSDYNNF